MSPKNLVAITILVGLCSAAHGQFYKIPVYNPGMTITNFKNADLNHDGNPDLVAVSNGSVVSMLGNGHGGFGSPKLSTISGLNSVGVLFAASDFNNDGFVDVAVHGTDPVTGVSAVGVMLGNGDGTFKTTKVFALGSSSGY